MKKIISAIVIVLAVCVLSVFRPSVTKTVGTKTVGTKTVQAIDWTYPKAKSGIKSCFSKAEKMDLKKSTK